MKRIFVVFSLLLCFALPAHSALIELTDGYIGVYDPANEYTVVGDIRYVDLSLPDEERDYFSFELWFTDTNHGFDITLTAPDNLDGLLNYAVTTGLNFRGFIRDGGQLSAGETASFSMGYEPVPEDLYITRALTLGITDTDSNQILSFQEDSSLLSSDFGFEEGGNGGDDGGSNPIPVAPTVYLFLFGLILLLLKWERSSEGKYGEKQQSKLSKRFLKLFLILPLIAAVTACGNNSELDRKQASKLLKQNSYPLEIVKDIETHKETQHRHRFEEEFNLINRTKIASASIIDKSYRNGFGHIQKKYHLDVKLTDMSKPLVRGEEKNVSIHSEKRVPVLIYTVNFGEVTGIAFQNQEKTQALVEFTEVYTPTPFRALYEKTKDDNPKYSIEKRSRLFRLYDDGWRIAGSKGRSKENRTPPPEGFSYEDVEKMLN